MDQTTRWKGFYAYHDVQDNGIEHITRIPFTMNIEFDNGKITGTTWDVESDGLFDDPITIKGFMVDDRTSFMVTYPCLWYWDEEQNGFVKDEENKDYEVHYSGEYNNHSKCYQGDWTITLEEEREGKWQTDYNEKFLEGTWEMERVE
ncbi:MAG: hypothetical protein JJ975_00530 [Bacteroidia bacterium]|nr:hypothetical protein [Bacteroidia bacterium]